jgi:hypothetical protein
MNWALCSHPLEDHHPSTLTTPAFPNKHNSYRAVCVHVCEAGNKRVDAVQLRQPQNSDNANSLYHRLPIRHRSVREQHHGSPQK